MDKEQARQTFEDEVLKRCGIVAKVEINELCFSDQSVFIILVVLHAPTGTLEDFYRKLKLIPRRWYDYSVFLQVPGYGTLSAGSDPTRK